MNALIQSFLMVSVAEIGDKTQLLSILLAARFRVFWPILSGVLAATLINHAIVAWAGSALGALINPDMLNLGVSILFIAIAFWTLIPDKAPDASHKDATSVFITSFLAFFMAEMGDKTQLATLTLGAHYSQTGMVILGTTLGMLAANAPAIWCGETLLKKLPIKTIRIAACVIFLIFGIVGLLHWYEHA